MVDIQAIKSAEQKLECTKTRRKRLESVIIELQREINLCYMDEEYLNDVINTARLCKEEKDERPTKGSK